MIRKIFHTGDIHISKLQQYDTNVDFFEQQSNSLHLFFIQFIEHIKSQALNYYDARIVIAGDLYHDFNKVENSSMTYMKTAIMELLKLHPIVLIAGNHDCNDTNYNQMDTLTALEEFINGTQYCDNFHYYKNSECIEDENVVWCVYSRFDGTKKPDIESAKKIYGEDKIYLGLYHDPLQYCLDFTGKPLKGNHTFNDVGIFNGLDYCLMGDIHSHQVMLFDTGKAVYCGSPWQQNAGEYIDGHGFVEWTLAATKKSIKFKHIPLENHYAIVKVSIESENDITNGGYKISNIKNKSFKYKIGRVVVKWSAPYVNFTSDAIEQLKINVRMKWGVDIANTDIDKRYINNLAPESENIGEEVANSLVNTNMLRDFSSAFLRENYKDVKEEDITAIDAVVLKHLNKTETIPNSKKWNIEFFEGYNLFCFEHVKRTFNKGLTYLESKPSNQGGKTFYTHLVHLLLYGNKLKFADEAINYNDVFNLHLPQEKEAYIWGVVKIDGTRYVLSRIFKRNDGKVTHTFDMLKIMPNGSDTLRGYIGVLQNEKSAINTTNRVEDLFGTYKDFSFSSFYNSENLSKWIMVKGRERYLLLSTFLGFGVLEDKFEIAKKLRKQHENDSILSKYNYKTLIEEQEQKEEELYNIQSQIDVVQSERETLNGEIESIKNVLAEFKKMLRPVIKIDFEYFTNKSIDLGEELKNLTEELKTNESYLNSNLANYAKMKKEYEKMPNGNPKDFSGLISNIKEIENKLYSLSYSDLEAAELNAITNKISKLQNEYSVINSKIKDLQLEISNIPPTENCLRCGQTFDSTEKLEKMQSDLVKLKEDLEKIVNAGAKERIIYNQFKERCDLNVEYMRQKLQKEFDAQNEYFLRTKKASDEEFNRFAKELYSGIMEYETISSASVSLENRIAVVEREIKIAQQKIAEGEKQLENQEWNKKYEDLIETSNADYTKLLLKLNDIDTQMKHLSTKKCYIEEMIVNLNEKINLHIEASKVDRLYQAYLELHSDEGVSKNIINHILPALNQELSALTEQVANISIYMKCEDKGIKFYYKRHGKENQLKYASGFEKTAACLAIHSVCMKNTLIPTSNILCLDEILAGTVAEANIEKMEGILRHLNNIYPCIDIISHNTPDVKVWCDHTIEIINKNGIANVL